jgi:putative glutamine amidotransferase
MYLARAPKEVAVPTYHHQAAERLGTGLTASGHAEDGTIEALETAGSGSFVLGVRWHPEAGDDLRVMQALFAAAGASTYSPEASTAGTV